MADEDIEVEGGEGEGKSGKLKIILLIVGVLVLLGAAVGGTVFYMQSTMQAPATEVEGEGAGEAEKVYDDDREKAIYHKLRPEFIVTFDANNRQRYVQMEVTLVTRDPETVALLANHNPLIRNALVLLFAQQDYLELQTPEGKENLKKQARDKVNELLMNEAEKETIEAVLFTNFVMQ